jgi:hypothetical protein
MSSSILSISVMLRNEDMARGATIFTAFCSYAFWFLPLKILCWAILKTPVSGPAGG